MMAEKPEDTNKPWMIRDVPEYVRRKVKIYAVQRGITIAHALEQIINQVIPGVPSDIMEDPRGEYPSYPQPLRRDSDDER